MADDLNALATDAAIADLNKPTDTVSLPASEVLRLRGIEREHETLSRDTSSSFLERDLATALEGADLIPGGANQLLRLWKDDFISKRVDGRWITEAKGGGSVADVVKSRLASGDYNHFRKAGNRSGGANSDATTTTATGGGGQPTQLEQIAANMRAQRQSWGGRGISGHPRS